MGELRARIAAAPVQFVIVAEDEQHPDIALRLAQVWQDTGARPSGSDQTLALPPVSGRVAEAWTTNTQVNFCARAYPAVAWSHPDAPALTVLGGYLRNGFLHTAIREKGGAYGGGAGFDADSAAFRFYSYRDPRLAETLADFDRALAWLHDDGPPAAGGGRSDPGRHRRHRSARPRRPARRARPFMPACSAAPPRPVRPTGGRCWA